MVVVVSFVTFCKRFKMIAELLEQIGELFALIAVNLLLSADWVRDRVAARIKEQTGRELKVNGTTALLFTPGPQVIISDAITSV